MREKCSAAFVRLSIHQDVPKRQDHKAMAQDEFIKEDRACVLDDKYKKPTTIEINNTQLSLILNYLNSNTMGDKTNEF